MNHRSQLKKILVLLLLLLVFVAGCVRLPEYAQPRFHTPETDGLTNREGFNYRQLDVKDFQAESLSPYYNQFNHHIGAQSCISIRPSKDVMVRIVPSNYRDMSFYIGSISQLKFKAIFVPECSWWNPNLASNRENYVLQHEQIHFALMELAARKLTSKVSDEVKSYLAIGDTYIETQKEINEKLQTMVREAMEINMADHTDFDKDTSMHHDPGVQRRWLQRVNTSLAELIPTEP